jgi:mannosyltransferase OCH1-like enzyme
MLRSDLKLERVDPEFVVKNKICYESRNQELASLFRQIYYRNIREAENDRKRIRIPRIVHQIWLGSPVPETFRKWMRTWENLKGWKYKLWTEKEVASLHLYNQDLYDASTSFAEKADIVRLEILSQFGGVYADVDFECLKPEVFEELHNSFDFYIGFEPLEHGYTNKFNMFKVCNALFASSANHPLLQELIVNLKANYLAYYNCCLAVQRSGPSYLTRIICEYELSGVHAKRNMYLPCTFFYPISERETSYFFEHPELSIWIAEETAGIHYWWGTWWKSNPYSSCIDSIKKTYPTQEDTYE